MNVKKYKIVLPWLLEKLGMGKLLRERIIHTPEAMLESASADAEVTPEQFRRVEATLAKMLGEGIVIKLAA